MNVKPRLRIVADECNNVRRMCTVSSTALPVGAPYMGRTWQIITPLRNATADSATYASDRWYHCRNIVTGAEVIAPAISIHNLY